MNPPPAVPILFTWMVKEASVDVSGRWDGSPQRELVLNVDAYLMLLERLGAKVTGLLVTLAAMSQQDPDTGMRYVEGSQERIGQKASGGAFGWSPNPTRDALSLLINNGYLTKIEGQALGRNRGSSPPKWVLSPSLFALSPVAPGPVREEPSNPDPLTNGTSNVGAFNNNGSKPQPTPSVKRHQFLSPPKTPSPHEMGMDGHIHPWSDDNDAEAGLLTLATIRALHALGWMNPDSVVAQYGPHVLAAWVLMSQGRSNPGGYIRSQTKKPGWPFFPPGWVATRDTVNVTPDGRLERGAVDVERTTPPQLSVADIVQILEDSGELGKSIKRAWLEAADSQAGKLNPAQRSQLLQSTGAELLEQYGLLDGSTAAESA